MTVIAATLALVAFVRNFLQYRIDTKLQPWPQSKTLIVRDNEDELTSTYKMLITTLYENIISQVKPTYCFDSIQFFFYPLDEVVNKDPMVSISENLVFNQVKGCCEIYAATFT